MEFFLDLIIFNPYLKNSKQIVSFLKDDIEQFYSIINKCKGENFNPNEELLKKSKIDFSKDFLKNIIENYPNF